MNAAPPTLTAIFLTTLLAGCAASGGGSSPSRLAGAWVLDVDRTAEVQPANKTRRNPLSSGGHVGVVVGGIPIPTGGGQPPPVAGTARDPQVLSTRTLTIRPDGDQLHLDYAGGETETLQRGDDQGLISDWSGAKLTSRYETTSRKVSQVYRVQNDGSLLVTVRLNPNQGAGVVHKRVFVRAPTPETASE